MQIEIDDSKTIDDIQERFSLCFPFLKIEFYNEPHQWGKSSQAKDLIDPGTLIRDIRKTHTPGVLEIKSWYKTGEVEYLFKKLFGLNAQIFRLDRNSWKQSAESDDITLAGQSEIAVKNQ